MKRMIACVLLAAGFAAAALCGRSATALYAAVEIETAVFAGGCFWCMEAEFDQQDGVIDVTSGYMGGSAENASYYQVASGATGHIEVVQVKYNPAKVSYERLLKIFWSNVDPTDAEGQFCDKGSQYVAGIFYFNGKQKEAAENAARAVEARLGVKVKTFLREAMPFYPAEEAHQEYYKKNQLAYRLYKSGCGRDRRLEEIWGRKPAETEAP